MPASRSARTQLNDDDAVTCCNVAQRRLLGAVSACLGSMYYDDGGGDGACAHNCRITRRRWLGRLGVVEVGNERRLRWYTCVCID